MLATLAFPIRGRKAALVVLALLGALPGCGRPDEATSGVFAAEQGVDDAGRSWERAKILRCHDGDTCTAQFGGSTKKVTLRLAGIDAPEVASFGSQGQPFGKESRDYTASQLCGSLVRVVKIDTDMYGRTLAEVYRGRTNLNMAIVKGGYAEAYRFNGKEVDKKAYKAAESKAKAGKLGIWQQARYESPYDYRRKQKQRD
jgi:endonuclease YncB( thermonuclease family)